MQYDLGGWGDIFKLAEKNSKKMQEDEEDRKAREFQEQVMKEQQKASSESGNEDKRSGASKLWDQVNIADSGRSWKTKDPSEEQSRRSTINQLEQSVLKSTGRTRSSIDALTGHLDKQQMEWNEQVNSGEITKEEYQKRLNDQLERTEWAGTEDKGTLDRLKKGTGVAAGTISELYPGGSALKGATLGSKVLRGVVGGATAGAAGGVGEELAEEDNEFNLANVASQTAFGAVTGGAGEVVGGVLGRALGKNKSKPAVAGREASEAILDAELGVRVGDDVVNDVQPTQPQIDESKLLPETTQGNGARPVEEVAAEREALQRGEHPMSSDPEMAKQRFEEVRAEEELALQNQAETEFQMGVDSTRKEWENIGAKSPEEVQARLDAIENGEIPETAYIDRPPVQRADNIVNDEAFPVEMREAAQEVQNVYTEISNKRSELMTEDIRQFELTSADMEYNSRMEALQGVPEIRAAREAEMIEADYQAKIDDIESRAANDAEELAKLDELERSVADKEMELVADSNTIMSEMPDQFRQVDEVELNAQKESLSRELELAQSNATTSGVAKQVAEAPNPSKFVDDNPQVLPAAKTEAIKAVDATPNPTVKNVGNLEQHMLSVMSPSKILEKMGLRGLHTDVFTAFGKMNRNISSDLEKVSEIGKVLRGNVELGNQVVDYIEGNRKSITATGAEAAELIKSFLDEKRTGLQEAGFKTMDDYFPHMFDGRDRLAKEMFKGQVDGKISFGNLKQRSKDAENYSKDIVDVLTRYTQSYHKKMELEPALKPLQDLKTADNIRKAEMEWIDNYTEQVKGVHEGNVEKKFDDIMTSVMGKDMTGAYRRSFGTQRMISASATMGLNPATAIRNGTQVINTVAELGPKYSAIGSIEGTRALLSGKDSAMMKEMMDAGIFDGGMGKVHYAGDVPTIRGKLSNATNRAAEGMMSLIRVGDTALRAQAYWGAKALAESKGLKGKAARDFAIEKVIDTQFITSKVDMPTALNGPGVRSMSQFATFSAKQAEFLQRTGVKMIKDDKGNWKLDPKRAGNAVAAGLTAATSILALQPLIGMDEKEFVPFYDQIASVVPGLESSSDGIYRSPFIKMVFGDDRGKDGLVQLFQALGSEDDERAVSEKFGKVWNDNWSTLVPGGTQIKKTYEGAKTTAEGLSKNAKGNVRFLQDMDGFSKVKGLLFGQYATGAGRKWIESGMPTLTEGQMNLGDKSRGITFEDLPRETQKQYYDFYSKTKQITGRQDAIDEIKQFALSGNAQGAARVASEYNKKANEALAAYWEENQDMPQALQDQMFSDILIDVGRISDNTSRAPSEKTMDKFNRYNQQDLR